MILDGFRDQIQIPGEISSPGMVSDPRNLNFRKFRPNSDFGRPNSDFEPAIFSLFSLRRELSLRMRSSFHSNLPGKLPNCKTNVQNSHTM